MKCVSSDRIAELIRNNMLFQNISPDNSLNDQAIMNAVKITSVKDAQPGDVVFQANSIGDAIFLVLKGEIGVYLALPDGGDSLVATVDENNFFGEIAMIDPKTTRTATVRAVSDCLLGVIGRDDFWQYYHTYPQIGVNLLWAINKRMKNTNTKLLMQMVKEKETLLQFNKELERQVIEKTDELRQKDVQLMQMDRIAGTAILAAGIAHEINNPLSFVSSSINFLEKSLQQVIQAVTYFQDKPMDAATREDYNNLLEKIHFQHIKSSLDKKSDMIKRGIARIATIVNSLRSVSRVDQAVEGDLNINQSIAEMLTLLSSQKEGKVQFVTNFTDIPELHCVTSEINQCLFHIMTNALDAVDAGGIIEFHTLYNAAQNLISIRITDNGAGMSDEVLQKAFKPFFTTKPVGSGTGLGLSICQAIVKRHDGNIEIQSKEGDGTSVILTFPLNTNR